MSTKAATPLHSREALPFKTSMMAMLGIALVSMLIALDQTVVSTALPSIIKDLDGFKYYTWVANSYLLASVAVVPVFGRLGDLFGRKKFVITSVVIFTLASVLCGLANDMPQLIIARALQGLGGGMMVGNAFACVPDLFPSSHDRIRWQVVIAMAFGTGTALGPTLGGILSEEYSWRWAFLINLPVGVFSLVILSLYLPRTQTAVHSNSGKRRVDYLGGILITALLASSEWLAERATNQGMSPANIALLGAILLCGFVFYKCEQRASHPIVPLSLLRQPDTCKLLVLSVLLGCIMFSLMYFIPLLLQGSFGMTPQQAGIIATPFALCMALGSMLNTRIITRMTKPVGILILGFTLMMLCACAVNFLTRQSSELFMLLVLASGGIGLGFSINNLNVFSQDLVGKNYFGIITALLQSTRMIGGMLGTTLIGTFINVHYAQQIKATLSTSADPMLSFTELTQLADPQILLDSRRQNDFTSLFHGGVNEARGLIELGRMELTHSMHIVFLSVGIIAILGVVISFTLLHLRLNHNVVITEAEQ